MVIDNNQTPKQQKSEQHEDPQLMPTCPTYQTTIKKLTEIKKIQIDKDQDTVQLHRAKHSATCITDMHYSKIKGEHK